MTPGLGIEPGTHWWKASALTTTPTLLPYANPAPLNKYITETKTDVNDIICTCTFVLQYLEHVSTVPLKSKLTLETRDSILELPCSKCSCLESRGSRIEDRETRLSRICKNSKGFRGNDLFLEGRTIQYCPHLQYKFFALIVIA